MDANIEAVLLECSQGSANGSLTFPQVVGKLMAAGVERYHADLTRAEKTYYLPDGNSRVLPNVAVAPAAETFDSAGIEAALRAVQAQRTNYRQFCEDVAAAGCVGYLVSIPGRRAVYYGRGGETFVEPFPQAK